MFLKQFEIYLYIFNTVQDKFWSRVEPARKLKQLKNKKIAVKAIGA